MRKHNDASCKRRTLAAFFLIVLLEPLFVATSAHGACCVCTGCLTGPTTQCTSFGSCDRPDFGAFQCALQCAAQCSGSNFTLGSCATTPGCASTVGLPVAGRTIQLAIALLLCGIGFYYLRRHAGPRAARAAVMTMTLLAGIGALYAAAQMQLAGGWQPTGSADLSTDSPPRWTANLVRGDDNALSGRVTVTGSNQFTAGNFQGQLANDHVTGTLTDDEGNQMATIVGTIQNGSFQGQYTTPDGHGGTFNWDTSNL